MRVEVISIGDELLFNEVLDTNAAYIMRSLQELDADIVCKVTVADEQAIIADALQSARRRADVVITTGGLGIQHNDFTRQAVADVTEGNVIEKPLGVVLDSSHQRTQSLFIDDTNGVLICLPGHHREMAYLLETEVLPYLRNKLPMEGTAHWHMLRTAGVMESTIRQILLDLPLKIGQRISYTSYAGQTDIRAIVRAESAEVAETDLEQLTTEIYHRLGDHIYGEEGDRLEQVVLEYLLDTRLRVAIAEYETDHILARLLQGLPKSTHVVSFLPVATLEGFVRYLDLDSTDGDLTRWCREAGERLRQRTKADAGLVVYNHITPGGVQLLITLVADVGVSIMQRSFGGHPGNMDQWAGILGLVHLRRWLLAYHPRKPFALE